MGTDEQATQADSPGHRETIAELDALRREVAETKEALTHALAVVLEAQLELRRETAKIHKNLTRTDTMWRRNVHAAGYEQAAKEGAEFAQAQLVGAAAFWDRYATLRHALSLAPESGLALEFGVYRGKTLGIIRAARRSGPVVGFDAFEGLPQAWRPGFPAGHFAVEAVPQVPGADIVAGWFDITLPTFLRTHSEPIDFLHIDCDLYESTMTVLRLVGPRLRVGSIIEFDDYYNYPGWREGEFRAWSEYTAVTGIEFEYVAYTYTHEQVAVRLTQALQQ